MPQIRIPRKVLKGGSHLCAPNYCKRYRPAARHAEAMFILATSPETAKRLTDAIRAEVVESRGERDAAIRVAVEKYVATLERHCRAQPYNWFNFFDFWQKK